MRDRVDLILDQWHRELPGLDPSPMGVVGRISRAARLLQEELEPVFAEHGLNGGGFDVLATLRRAGPPFRLTPSALGETLMVSSGGMTKRLRSLEEAGLIRRTPSADDRRSSLVELSSQGRQLVETAVATHVENEQRLLSALGARDRDRLAGLLRTLLVGIGDAAPRPARRVRPSADVGRR